MVAVSEGGGSVVSGSSGRLASDEDKPSGVSFSPLVVVPGGFIAENAIWEVYT